MSDNDTKSPDDKLKQMKENKAALERQNKRKRIVLSKIKTKAEDSLKLDAVHLVMSDAMSIVAHQVHKLKEESIKKNRLLNNTESSLLTRCLKSLVELSKEERERTKDVDLSSLSDDQLLEFYNAASDALDEKMDKIESGDYDDDIDY